MHDWETFGGRRSDAILECVLVCVLALFITLTEVGIAPATDVRLEAVSAQSCELNRILDRIDSHYRETDSFRAKFTEQISSVGGLTRSRSGIVYYQRPGKMRWEFAAPELETIVSDGVIVYNYEPDLNQVIETPLKRLLRSPGATAFLLGMGDLRSEFNASLPAGASADGMLRVVLVPKEGGDRVEVGLDPQTYNLASLVVSDPAGNVTTLHFTDFETKREFPSSLFKFAVPDGADIVRTPGA